MVRRRPLARLLPDAPCGAGRARAAGRCIRTAAAAARLSRSSEASNQPQPFALRRLAWLRSDGLSGAGRARAAISSSHSHCGGWLGCGGTVWLEQVERGQQPAPLLLSVVPEGAVLGATATLVPTTKGCGVITEGLRPIGVKPQ